MEYRVLDVESHSLKVEQHLKRTADGVYCLPEFQRTFVWDDARVLKLWDSLHHGFPIGQLMLWSPNDLDFPMRALGRRQREVDPKIRSTAIIDGQQRLSALYLVLTGDIALRYDLEEERFVYGEGVNRLRLDILNGENAQPVSFSEVAADQFFFLHATEEQKAKHARKISQLNSVLTQRELPSQVIRDADYATVLGVFKRLNEQGEPLSEIQLTMAGISQHWPGVFRRTYDLLQRLNVEMGFDQGEDPAFVFRVWTAVHTGQHLVKHLAPESPRSKYAGRARREDYQASWNETERGIGRLLDVMRNDLDLTNFRFIRAQYPLAVAAHYYATHPSPSPEAERALVRWLILGLVSGRYHERPESKYADDIRATHSDKDVSALFRGKSALDPAAAEINLSVDRLLTASSRSAYATLLFLVTRKLGGTDWRELNLRVGDLLSEGAWQYHRIFPDSRFDEDRDRLKEALEDAQEAGDDEKMERIEKHLAALEARVSSLGNLAFVTSGTHQKIADRAPAEYLKELSATEEGRRSLEAQQIPLDPLLWKQSSFDVFCRRRCEVLAARAKKLFFSP